ncbi:outer membrane protein assembly factor BamA [bacterium]|nr:outer membrane protein assembly factor BamA [bacterium]MCI0604116.1 outer membrane protein assembly factor BamA [bacterium]
MKYILSLVAFFLLLSAAFGQDNNTVSSVRIEGNQRIATETYLYYISVKAGDPYDEGAVQSDFRRLWQTGFLDDLKVETETTPKGIEVIFKVKERPLVKTIEYTGNKKVSTDDIQTKLKDENINIRTDQPLDSYIAQRVVNSINKLMTEKGLQFGSASYKTEPIGDSYTKLVFVVDEGPNVKIGDIEFDGNKVFSDGKLKGRMKDTKEHWMFSWITKKDDFEKEKFEKDMERVEELYFNHGYINARIDEPKIELDPKNKERMKLTIPVREGRQYKVGNIEFTGNTVFDSQKLLPKIPLQQGKVFNRSLLKEGVDEIQKLYGDEGYIYVSIGPVFDVKKDKDIVDLKMEVQENGQFYVNRMEFTGNDYTRDKVIRREMLIQEGELLRVSKFRESIDRIYRLGFFEDLKPNITPVSDKTNQADIAVEVKENKRNEIRLGGGYSELDGFFGDVVFSTKNLFGSGKIFTLSLQSGTRTKNYAVQVLEPYFLDRRIALGFSVFRSRYDYFNYLKDTIGGNVSFGFHIVGDLRGAVSYGYQTVDIDLPGEITIPPADESLFPGAELLQSDRIESRVIPQILRNTINNPIDPSRGTRFVFSNEIVGGPFGGDVSYYKPSAAFTMYLPGLTKKHHTDINVEGGYATGFNSEELPFYERYYLGGEQSIRGYDVRTVSPIRIEPLSQRLFLVGGNKYFLINAEYVMPLAGPLKIAAFVDYGNAFDNDHNISLKDMRGSTGFEVRFTAPFLSAPFRFIWAYNFNYDDLLILPPGSRPERTTFRFSVGTTF